MVFKGEAKGIEFSLDGQRIISADPVFKKEMEMAINLRYDEYSASVVFMDNHIGRCIVRDYGGRVISEEAVTEAPISDPDIIY